jgi:serine/threonine protein kinase
MELCAGGDLLTYVRRRGCLSEDVVRDLFKQAVSAVHYCHRKGIIHRDIKLDNFLLDISGDTPIVKLCDFGVSKVIQEGDVMFEQCGTPAYIAPEILIGCRQGSNGYTGFSPDVWSLGVCLYALLFGTVPFKASNIEELHRMIVNGTFSLKKRQRVEKLSPSLKSLMRGLLEVNPQKRLTLDQVRSHSWFKSSE